MFTENKWFHRGRIESSEGFSVGFGRDTVIYRESGRRMAITADIAAGQANLFTSGVGGWDDAPSSAVSDDERQKILNNVKRALEFRGLTVNLLP
jgi:hypothetical protein